MKDLRRPGAPTEIFDELIEAQIQVSVLVNCAGIGIYGPFEDSDLEEGLAMMQTNMAALVRLTRLFIVGMLARGDGKILNVASTAAFQPGPLMAVYCATKAFVLSFTEALANELSGSAVSACVLCPGPTHSCFKHRAGMDGSRVFERGVMDAETVAGIGFRGLMADKTVIIPGIVNRLLAFLVRLAPRRLVVRLARATLDKPAGKRRASRGHCQSSHVLASNSGFRVDIASERARKLKSADSFLENS